MPNDAGFLGLAKEPRYDSELQQELVENAKMESEIPCFLLRLFYLLCKA